VCRKTPPGRLAARAGPSRLSGTGDRSGSSAPGARSEELRRAPVRLHREPFAAGCPPHPLDQPPALPSQAVDRALRRQRGSRGYRAGATRAPKIAYQSRELQFQFFTLQQDVETNRRLRFRVGRNMLQPALLRADSRCRSFVAPASARSSTKRDAATLAAAVLGRKGCRRRYFQSARNEQSLPRASRVSSVVGCRACRV